ncbi:MAG: hypothetical protein PHC92_09450 [Syntrophomonadaceae bacterium]|nr:hypothetical protein [Syntrophomonadaceae bacterium]MDD3023514.1 hypothetical protein [Syntrophomonadaceae bacterium]
MANITILAGGFGSGKSEIALNFALEKVKRQTEHSKVILADLDLVNPFFASREAKKQLEDKGVRLLGPRADLAFGDVPQLPPEIIGIIGQDNDMIIDLAGDEVGSLVLGYLSSFIKIRNQLDFFMVINPYRPFACDLESVVYLKNMLEAASKTHITGIISNPNLVEETDAQIILEGHTRVLKYADAMGIPVKYLTVEEKFYEQFLFQYGNQLKLINLYLRPGWLKVL